jgi:hypothetical protein
MIPFTANAQKLPTIQQISVRAPADIKIDGKTTEWDNKFQAYNKATDVYYTIANDDDKLYLIIQATEPTIITKIVCGGITFTINHSGQKKDKNGMAVTFPAYDRKNPPVYEILNNKPNATRDTVKNRMQADSFLNAHNKQLKDKLKLIDVVGIKAIKDSEISINNEEGIKAVSLFDNKIYYTYELAIPLKYIEFTADKSLKFSYNIKLNGLIPKGSRMIDAGRPDLIVFVGPDGVNYNGGKATPENMILYSPTDFWGEYTLAKK